MPTDTYTGTQLSKLSSWFADARTRPVRNILSLVPVDQRPAIAAATSVYPIAPAMIAAAAIPGIWSFPKGDYVLNSDSQVRMLTPGVSFVGQPGARLLLQDGGASNPLIVQDTTDILIEGIEIIDQRVTKSGAGITIYNSTKVTVQKVTVADFALYGIVASDNPEGVSLVASTISYSGNTISDTANGLAIFPLGLLGVSGSLYNNHIFTATNVTAGAITVAETLITEAAGESRTYAESNTISFNATTRRVGSPDPLFQSFRAGDQAIIADAAEAGNNQTVDIVDVDIDGDGFTTEQALVTEAAGATVTVTKIGRSRIQVMDMAAIDDLTIDHNTVRNCGHIGIEVFPKVKSKNLQVTFNTVYECGKTVTGGCGIKASQGYINAKVTDNTLLHCQIGMIVTSWDTTEVSRNHVLNCQKHGIAIGVGDHIRYVDATYGTLQMHGNLVEYTTDVVTGEPYESTFSYPAINLTGTKVSTGLIDIAFNDIHKWKAGLTCKYILRSHPNLSFRYNKVRDSGSSVLIPVIATGDTTSGSEIITDVKVGGIASVGGFAIGSEIHGPGIPANTFVMDLDGPGKTLTLGNEAGTATVNATATAGDVAIYSAYLDGAKVIGNEFTNTDILGDQILTITATGGTFTLTGNGSTTAAIAENAAAATVQTAVVGLGGKYVDAVVSGADGGPYTIATAAVVPLVPSGTGLTGGAATAVITRPDAANLTVQVYSTNANIFENKLDGMGAYGVTVAGDGTALIGNKFKHPNPSLIANRGVVNLAAAGTYHIHDNYADVSTSTIALTFMVNNTNATDVHITNTYASEEWVRPLLNVTPVASTGLFGQFGKQRITYGTAAPTDLTRNRYQGDIHINTAPTEAKNILYWSCITTGSVGQVWRAHGSGSGTTAQQPVLVAFDKHYHYENTTTGTYQWWNGVAWIH